MLSKLTTFMKTKLLAAAVSALAAIYASAKAGVAAFLRTDSPANHANLADFAKAAAVFVTAYIGAHADSLVPGEPLAKAIIAAVVYLLSQTARGPKPPGTAYTPWQPTTMPAVVPAPQA